MYRCELNILLTGVGSDISEWVVTNTKSIFPENYDVSIDIEDSLNGRIVRNHNVIIANVKSYVEEAITILEVSKDNECEVILMVDQSEMPTVFSKKGISFIDDIWPYSMSLKAFGYRYAKWARNYIMRKEKWLAENYLNTVINCTDDLVWFKDKAGVHHKVNESFCNAVGKTHDDIRGRGHYYIWDITPEEYVKGEFVCMESEYEVMSKKEKCFFDENVLIKDRMRQLKTCKAPLFDLDGSVMGTVGVAKDVTSLLDYKSRLEEELKRSEKRLITDELTGLYNRRAYEKDMEALSSANSRDDCVYVSLDINGLKAVNDEQGIAAGDELLIAAVSCMRACFEEYGRLYRIGGDEFAALLIIGESELEMMLHKLDRDSFGWNGQYISSFSIATGVVKCSEFPTASMFDISKEANSRMNDAKAHYYARKGIDRRGQQDVLSAICSSYERILKVNLSTDSFSVIKSLNNDKTLSKSYADTVSSWLEGYIQLTNICDEYADDFGNKTKVQYLREYFRAGNDKFSFYYSVMDEGVKKNMLLEMFKSDEYNADSQLVYLFIKVLD